MNTKGQNSVLEVEFNPTGRGVALLALEAADEIDDLCLGKEREPKAALQLARGLKRAFIESERPVIVKAFIDSESVAVLFHALDDSQWGGDVASVGDLANKANEVSEVFERAVAKRQKNDLERVRDFCVALANASSSFRQSVYALRPAHPFRS